MLAIIQREKIAILSSLFFTVLAGLGLSTPPAWHDETASLSAINRSWNELFQMLENIDVVHSFYYIAMKILTLNQTSYVELRIFSLIFLGVAIFVTFKIAEFFENRRAGILAALSLSIFPSSLYYASEARPYTAMMASTALCIYFLVKYLFKPSSSVIPFWIFLIISTWLQIMVILLLPVIFLFFVLQKKSLRQFFPYLLIYLALTLPIFIVGYSQRTQISWLSKSNFMDPISYAFNFIHMNAYYFVNSFSMTMMLSISLFSIAVLLFHFFGRRIKDEVQNRKTLFLLLWLFVPSYSLLLIGTQVSLYHPRYVIYCQPALAVIIGIAFSRLKPEKIIAGVLSFLLITLGFVHRSELRSPLAKSNWHKANSVIELARFRTDKIWFADIAGLDRTPRTLFLAYPENYQYYDDIALGVADIESNTLFSISKSIQEADLTSALQRGFLEVSWLCPTYSESVRNSIYSQENWLKSQGWTHTDLIPEGDACWLVRHWTKSSSSS